jgi:copper homeostasis protein
MECKLEICVDSIESAINAQSAGADRVEFCSNLIEGGTTSSYGTLVSVRSNLSIGLHAIIRPRGGDFLYSDQEYDIMRRDIELCGELGADGIVTGILHPDGHIDVERTAKLFEFAYPMSTTFHRAFDMCNDPFQGLEDVIDTGADRLLTSGMKQRAETGIELIRQLIHQAGDRMIIMPGGGIDESNIGLILTSAKIREVHLSGRKEAESHMVFRRHEIIMSNATFKKEYFREITDPVKIKNIINIIKMM